MIDIKFLREHPDIVKENIKKKFQDEKLVLVDEVIDFDAKYRNVKLNGDNLRSERKTLSSKIGELMKAGKKDEANAVKAQVTEINNKLEENEKLENEYSNEIHTRMMKIPNIMHESVPIGKDDSENVEIERFGEPIVPDYEIPFHGEILEKLGGLDLDSARRVAGNGFYYLIGDVARLHSAVLTYARDFMINKGLYLLHPSIYDQKRRCNWRYEL